MNIIYAQEKLTPSIFLAGPTPRCKSITSWRDEALTILRDLDFQGDVFVPEPRSSDHEWNDETYDSQVVWEWKALNNASCVAFWIPRSLTDLPGFTTNVEFGAYISTDKSVLGYPHGAVKMKYLHRLAERSTIPIFHTLEDTMKAAVKKSLNTFTIQISP